MGEVRQIDSNKQTVTDCLEFLLERAKNGNLQYFIGIELSHDKDGYGPGFYRAGCVPNADCSLRFIGITDYCKNLLINELDSTI